MDFYRAAVEEFEDIYNCQQTDVRLESRMIFKVTSKDSDSGVSRSFGTPHKFLASLHDKISVIEMNTNHGQRHTDIENFLFLNVCVCHILCTFLYIT